MRLALVLLMLSGCGRHIDGDEWRTSYDLHYGIEMVWEAKDRSRFYEWADQLPHLVNEFETALRDHGSFGAVPFVYDTKIVVMPFHEQLWAGVYCGYHGGCSDDEDIMISLMPDGSDYIGHSGVCHEFLHQVEHRSKMVPTLDAYYELPDHFAHPDGSAIVSQCQQRMYGLFPYCHRPPYEPGACVD